MLMLVSVHVTSFLFLVWFNNSALTMDFYQSYTLLLQSPVLMRSWSRTSVFILCILFSTQMFYPSSTATFCIHQGISPYNTRLFKSINQTGQVEYNLRLASSATSGRLQPHQEGEGGEQVILPRGPQAFKGPHEAFIFMIFTFLNCIFTLFIFPSLSIA